MIRKLALVSAVVLGLMVLTGGSVQAGCHPGGGRGHGGYRGGGYGHHHGVPRYGYGGGAMMGPRVMPAPVYPYPVYPNYGYGYPYGAAPYGNGPYNQAFGLRTGNFSLFLAR